MPYSFKNFWLPFIVVNLIMVVITMLVGDTDPAFGVLFFSVFYFYNRGYKNGQKDIGKNKRFVPEEGNVEE